MRTLICVMLAFAMKAEAQNHVFSPFNYQPSDITGSDLPFLWLNTQDPSLRYQQVYGKSDFLPFTSGPQQITEITFSTGAGALNVNLPNVQIDLSTTQKVPDGLSTAFSENQGPDDTIVYSGAIHLSGVGAYDIHIPLQHPFMYDPALGNLLLDVRNFQTIAPYFPAFVFTAALKMGDSSSIAVAYDVNSPTAFLGTGALLTEFTVTSVPEPSAFLLLFIGAIPLGFVLRHRNRKP